MPFQPMLATSGPLPTGPGWSYEFKWDGIRAIVDCRDERVTITSRNGNDVTIAYPELHHAADSDVLLDGEIVAFDSGVPSFELLQSRMHVRSAREAKRLATAAPVTYLVFDVLRLHGVDLTARPYDERRATLDRLAETHPDWTVSPSFDDGAATFAAARANKLEGVVAKRTSSLYRPGARTNDWVKVKFAHTDEFIVIGWESGTGQRASTIGSLLLGYYDDAGALMFAGQAGSGLARDSLALLTPWQRRDSPVSPTPDRSGRRATTWVEPKVVVEVEYGSWTSEGRLRHPVFRGVRPDKDPGEVTVNTISRPSSAETASNDVGLEEPDA